MRAYQLYLIEDEFATHYFGREWMFFQLFQEHEYFSGELKTIIGKQIQFITKEIPSFRLHQYIKEQVRLDKDFQMKNDAYYLKIGKNSKAKLEIFDRSIKLFASGNYEAETTFFEILRKNEASFLAIDLEHERYGWLKPIKEFSSKKYVGNQQANIV